MPWLLLLLGLGGFALYEVTKTPDVSPSGKPWPAGVSGQDVAKAVSIALAHETNVDKLRDFARQLGPYSNADFAALNAKASQLEGAVQSPAMLPPSTAPTGGISTTIHGGILSR